MTGALIGFNTAAVAMTVAGGLVPLVERLFTRRWLWRMFSLRSGVLLAVAFTEILPEAWRHSPAIAGWGALIAFALLFAMGTLAMGDTCPEYLESCSVHLLGATALAALFAHSFIDGLNLTVSFSAGALAGTTIGVALALHKLVDGFTLTSLLARSGYSRGATLAALAAIAAATPVGSLASLWKISDLPPGLMAGALGFAAGSFVYIGAADIMPRLHRTEDKGCLAFFAAGLAAIAALRLGGAH
ncbi:MAG: ZIP family metal transporter [Elusimicrobiota bacterium]